MKTLIAGLALALGLAACVPPDPVATEDTLADVLLADSANDSEAGFDGNWYDFDIVTQALVLFPDLVDAASDPEASLTAFIPNDRAFQVLVEDLTGEWLDEPAVFDAVASLGTDTVETVLTYHIVGAKISAADALAANGAELTTLQGGTIGVDVVNPGISLINLKDADTNDDDPSVVFSKFNYGGELSNGYLHGISLVLRPADL